jgi:hypothetical protein
LIILSLLYGDGDFQKSLMIVNTGGWDTDCNSGNVGCLLGIRGGLAGIENGPDWRGPVADRMYLCTADGGRCITDALTETYHIVNMGRRLAGLEPVRPKGGSRFHFSLPGSVQGFQVDRGPGRLANVAVENASTGDRRRLAVRFNHLAQGLPARVATATFIPPEALRLGGYGLMASPTLHSGQVITARVDAGSENSRAVRCRLYVQAYGKENKLEFVGGPEVELPPGGRHEFSWRVPDTQGAPIAEVGVELSSATRADGTVYIDWLTWSGAPDVSLVQPPTGGDMWLRAWVDGVDHKSGSGRSYQLIQDQGTGLLIQGSREWKDYRVSATVTPHLVQAAGIASRVQGMRRYYALLLGDDGALRLVKALDGDHVLAEKALGLEREVPHQLAMEVQGSRIKAWLDGELAMDVQDTYNPLDGGGIALVAAQGRAGFTDVEVRPLAP